MQFLFENNKLTIPNFHAMLHVFDQAKTWSPPVLHWTRPFEHCHLLLRRQVQRSNMRDILRWIVKRDMLLEHIYYVRPDLQLQQSHRAGQRSLKDYGPDSLVVCNHPYMHEPRYAKIIRFHTRTEEMEVRFFKIGPMDSDLRCYRIAIDETEPEVFKINRRDVLRRFIIVNGMINRFCVLNTVRVWLSHWQEMNGRSEYPVRIFIILFIYTKRCLRS